MLNSRFVIITGLSGSGKSTALDALEDLGFYAVDNLPVALLPAFVQMPSSMMAEAFKAALVMDLRSPDFVENFPRIFNDLAEKDYSVEVIFLEANEDVLVRRFSQTRRQHPLGGDSILEGIKKEKRMLAKIRGLAEHIIDTSRFNVHELRREITGLFARLAPPARMHVNLLSFGFKYGLPTEADLVFDVRFLPNPYFVDGLRSFTGCDKPVVDFIFSHPITTEFMARLKDMLLFLIPHYHSEGKSQLTVAIGCTGGKHRSVALVEWLSNELKQPDCRISKRHRDIALG